MSTTDVAVDQGSSTPSSVDLRKRILEADDTTTELVYVSHWETELLVQSISAKERNQLLRRSMNKDTREVDENEMYARLVVATARDPETGNLIFRDKDIDALMSKNSAAVEKVAGVAARLCGISEEDKEKMGKPSSSVIQTSTETDDSASTWPSS